MPLHFDSELNARVHTREDGRCLSVEHVARGPIEPAGAPRGTPLETAIAYLGALSPRLGMRPPDARARERFQDERLLVEGVCLRLGSQLESRSRLDARRLVQLAFAQTARGVPVWRSGVSVDLVREGESARVVGLRSSVTHDEWDLDVLPLSSLRGHLTPQELEDPAMLRSVLKASTASGGGWSESIELAVHGAGYRVYRPQASTARRSSAPDFPLRLLPPRGSGLERRFRIVVEVSFTLSTREHAPSARSWRALVDTQSGLILFLEPLSAHACSRAMVLRVDPVTLDGVTRDVGPCPEDEAVQRLLEEVTLPDLSLESDGSGPLRNAVIAIRDRDRVVRTKAKGETLRYPARSVEFASVCAYYHLSTMFSFVERIGIPLDVLFDGRARPVYVEPRGEQGYGVAQTHPRLERGQIVGVEGFTFGDVAQCSGEPAMSNAVDVRLVWHEFSHAILMDTLHQRYLGFAHSFGDSLAALWCDPGTRASDRFATYPWTGIPRRHLRLGVKWSWANWSATDDEERLYEYEQMLSTCLFRLYRVSGGDYGRPHLIIDDRECAVRRSASRYIMNLIIRAMHQQTSAHFSPMSLPEHFVRALKQADETSDGYEEFPPGALRKVIDWAFERQGLECKGADVFLDDGSSGEYADIDGEREAAAKLYNEHSWLSKAIGVDDGNESGEYSGAKIHTKVGNRGSVDADSVTLRAHRAPLGVGITWADLELCAEVKLGRLDAGAPSRDIGPVSVGREGGPSGFVLELTTPQDESLPAHVRAQTPPLWQKDGVPLSLTVPFDNNLAWLARLEIPSTGEGYRHTFLVQNPLSCRARIRLDVEMPHDLDVDGWRLDLPSREIVLGPGRRRRVTLVLRPGAHPPSGGLSRIRLTGLAELDEQQRDRPCCAWPLGGFEIVVGPRVVEP